MYVLCMHKLSTYLRGDEKSGEIDSNKLKLSFLKLSSLDTTVFEYSTGDRNTIVGYISFKQDNELFDSQQLGSHRISQTFIWKFPTHSHLQ